MPDTNYFFHFSRIFGYDSQKDGQHYGDDFTRLVPILGQNPTAQPTELRVRAEKRIDGIQMFYQGNTGPIPLNKYGGDGGTANTITLDPNNPIASIQFWGVEMSNGNRLGQMVITFAGGQSITLGRTNEVLLGTLDIPPGFILGGLRAYYGSEINGLGGMLIPPLIYSVP